MPQICNARMTAQIDDEVVVFLIGMRINRMWKFHKWLPVARAMPRMLRELSASRDSGFLGFHQWFGNPTIAVQYWRSFDDLERYARDPGARHLPAWRAFNQKVRGSGDVGIWHETYRVRAGEYEAIYGNMPRVGLARVAEHLPLGSTSTAARRLGDPAAEESPVPGY